MFGNVARIEADIVGLKWGKERRQYLVGKRQKMETEERTAKCHDHKENFLYRRRRKKQAKKVIFGLAFLARM